MRTDLVAPAGSKVAVISIVLAVLSGCFIVELQDAPEIDGRLQQGDQVLEGVAVTRIVRPKDRSGCNVPGAEVVTTDAQGRFRFPRVSHRQRTFLFGDPTDQWRLCFDLGPGGLAWWERDKIAAPPQAMLSCRPASGAHHTYGQGSGEGVVCSVRDVELLRRR